MEKSTKEIKFIKDKAHACSALKEVIIEGARKMFKLALENEVDEFIQRYSALKEEWGRKIISRNGYMPQRDILAGIGPLTIKQPRVDDRLLDQLDAERFTSNTLPRYLRRIPSIDNLIPAQYLKGISTNDFGAALSAILGEGVAGLSATNIVRLKQSLKKDYND